jgi:hypothetical protein
MIPAKLDTKVIVIVTMSLCLLVIIALMLGKSVLLKFWDFQMTIN